MQDWFKIMSQTAILPKSSMSTVMSNYLALKLRAIQVKKVSFRGNPRKPLLSEHITDCCTSLTALCAVKIIPRLARRVKALVKSFVQTYWHIRCLNSKVNSQIRDFEQLKLMKTVSTESRGAIFIEAGHTKSLLMGEAESLGGRRHDFKEDYGARLRISNQLGEEDDDEDEFGLGEEDDDDEFDLEGNRLQKGKQKKKKKKKKRGRRRRSSTGCTKGSSGCRKTQPKLWWESACKRECATRYALDMTEVGNGHKVKSGEGSMSMSEAWKKGKWKKRKGKPLVKSGVGRKTGYENWYRLLPKGKQIFLCTKSSTDERKFAENLAKGTRLFKLLSSENRRLSKRSLAETCRNYDKLPVCVQKKLLGFRLLTSASGKKATWEKMDPSWCRPDLTYGLGSDQCLKCQHQECAKKYGASKCWNCKLINSGDGLGFLCTNFDDVKNPKKSTVCKAVLTDELNQRWIGQPVRRVKDLPLGSCRTLDESKDRASCLKQWCRSLQGKPHALCLQRGSKSSQLGANKKSKLFNKLKAGGRKKSLLMAEDESLGGRRHDFREDYGVRLRISRQLGEEDNEDEDEFDLDGDRLQKGKKLTYNQRCRKRDSTYPDPTPKHPPFYKEMKTHGPIGLKIRPFPMFKEVSCEKTEGGEKCKVKKATPCSIKNKRASNNCIPSQSTLIETKAF